MALEIVAAKDLNHAFGSLSVSSRKTIKQGDPTGSGSGSGNQAWETR